MKHLYRNAALTVFLLLASALVLSGCATFASPPTADQNQVIGPVRISFTVCASGGADGACMDWWGNSGQPVSSGAKQVFLGFRVPSGANAPLSFSSTATGPSDSGPQLQFTKSSAYTSELQRLDPAPVGKEWFGYTSQYVAYNSGSGEQNFSADVDFGLPERADGSPSLGRSPIRRSWAGVSTARTRPSQSIVRIRSPLTGVGRVRLRRGSASTIRRRARADQS